MHYALCAKHKLPYDGKVLRRAECAAAGSARAAEPPASGAMGIALQELAMLQQQQQRKERCINS